MLELIDTPPHKIVFLGPGCSVATRPVAEAAPYWEVVQVMNIPFTTERRSPHGGLFTRVIYIV